MPEHHKKRVTECWAWCNKCGRQTKHRVSDGRQQHCLEHVSQEMTQKQRRAIERREQDRLQPKLF